jgi:eukaryotic-like serine/threonine-protein kinase
MGSTLARDEMPVHVADVDAFWIMRTEVTNAQYARCVEAGICTPPSNDRWLNPTYADHPVTHIDWERANTYATWVGGRLPTETEWEKAARGTDEREYPWGNDAPQDHHLNFNYREGDTMPVGSYEAGASPYGLLDMAGNVEEWVADWYGADAYATASARNPTGPPAGIFRVTRGGSLNSSRFDVRTTARGRVLPNSAFPSVGFRVVLSD